MDKGVVPIKTAAIIVIGNEILSGRVHDTNAHYLSSELWSLGISVQRIIIIPDETETIGNITAEYSRLFDHIFTTGGIGPTHDDVTMAGIARGFGVSLVKHPLLEAFLEAHYGKPLRESSLKMALVPEGAEIIGLEEKRYPLIVFRNIFIFPGIPQYLHAKFPLIREKIRTLSFHMKTIYLSIPETDIADALTSIAHRYPEVDFGSYPVLGNPEYSVYVTAVSQSSESLQSSVGEFISRIPQDSVVKIT